MAERIYLNQISWCKGKDIIMLTVSTTHPRRTCKVDQVQYPDYSFFRDKT